MAIDRWSPFGDMMTLRDAMDRLLQESYVRPGSSMVNAGRTAMPLDVVEDTNDYVIYASMPGVKPQDVQITVQGDTLTIRGETSSSMNEPQHQQGQTHGQSQAQNQTQGQQAQGANAQTSGGRGQQGNYLMRERRQAEYFRQVTLPTNVNAEKAQAHFEHGELILTLPKAEEAKPKQIRIQGISPEGQITSGTKQGQIAGQTQGQTQGHQTSSQASQSSQTPPQGQQNQRSQPAGAGTQGS